MGHKFASMDNKIPMFRGDLVYSSSGFIMPYIILAHLEGHETLRKIAALPALGSQAV
jgi:hypothetical protein